MREIVVFSQEDLLTKYLFIASNTTRIKRGRNRIWIALVVLFTMLAILYSFDADKFLMWLFIAFGIILLLFFPFLITRILKRQYESIVAEQFNNVKNLPFEITLEDESISYKSNIGDVQLKISQIEQIDEIQNYFFLKFSSNDTITLPKRSFSYDLLNNYLMDVSTKNAIPFNRQLNWRWK